MSLFDTVVNTQSRPLPVIILADNSGSMSENGSLDSLKHALRDMIESFKNSSSSALEADIYVSVISFGNQKADIVLAPKSANEIANSGELAKVLDSMVADGDTPLGLALNKLISMLEDKSIYPSRAYRPFIVLASDGYPNDDWEGPLNQLLNNDRCKKATRLSLAIGPAADRDMLKRFINNEDLPVFSANSAVEIKYFFKCVTMSAIRSSQSAKPGEIAPNDIISLSESVKALFDED